MKKLITESINIIDELWFFGNWTYEDNDEIEIYEPDYINPFFLTNNLKYAQEYGTYGCQLVIFKKGFESNILDFKDKSMFKKLGWPDSMYELINLKDSGSLAEIAEIIIMLDNLYDSYKKLDNLYEPETNEILDDILKDFNKNGKRTDYDYEYDYEYQNYIVDELSELIGEFPIIKIKNVKEFKKLIELGHFFYKRYIMPNGETRDNKINQLKYLDSMICGSFYKDIESSGFDGYLITEDKEKNQVLALFNIKQLDLVSNHPISVDKVKKILSNPKIKTREQFIEFFNS